MQFIIVPKYLNSRFAHPAPLHERFAKRDLRCCNIFFQSQIRSVSLVENCLNVVHVKCGIKYIQVQINKMVIIYSKSVLIHREFYKSKSLLYITSDE